MGDAMYRRIPELHGNGINPRGQAVLFGGCARLYLWESACSAAVRQVDWQAAETEVIVLESVFASLAMLLFCPVAVLCLQVVMALLPRRISVALPITRPRVTILVPAHEEAAVIGDTLALLMPQLVPGDRLLVVADNCSDDTAGIARAAGAEVIARTDRSRRGKGYALDYGIRHLERDPPEVLIIVDADCRVEPQAIDRLARWCGNTGRPTQGLYLMHAPEGACLRMRIAAFAWRVKNQVRPLGYQRLGLPCQLMGTGMAFPWRLVAGMALANAHIVEDMKLGIDLARAGHPAMFCADAAVSSFFPVAASAVKSQRKRWEHGHLSLILQEVPRLLWRAACKADFRLLALVLDLLVPPLALLVFLLTGLLTLAAVAAALGASTLPLEIAFVAFGLLAIAVFLAWHGWARQVVSLRDLLSVPCYVLAKVPLYFQFWTHRQKDWVRTDRN